MKFKERILAFNEKHFKKLIIIPFLLILFAFIQLGLHYHFTGEFFSRGIGLKGGSVITINQPLSPEEIKPVIEKNFPDKEITLRGLTSFGKKIGLIIETSFEKGEEVNKIIEAIKAVQPLTSGDFSVEITSASLGSDFFRQAILALIIAFLAMALVVFLYFRTFVPSLAIVLAAFSDMVVSLAMVNLLGIKITTAGLIAFLMLIGYSVDTNILLTSRLLKRKEISITERFASALKTGLTMTFTTLLVLTIGLIFIESEIIKQIMLILIIGLLVDILMTWIQNYRILRIYLEKKHH